MSVALRASQLEDKYRPRSGPAIRFASAEERAAGETAKILKANEAAARFTEPQMHALMQMSSRTRNQSIYHDLRGRQSGPLFFLSDIKTLRDQRLAIKPEGRSFHMLTDAGETVATSVADYLVRTHGIHAAWITSGSGPSAALHCTCNWGCGLRKGDNMQRKADTAMSTHLHTVLAVNDLATALAPFSLGKSEGS